MARTGFERRARVASLVRQVVAELLAFNVKDPRVAGVTVTDTEITGDLREAKVFYFVEGDEARRADAQEGLNRAAGYIRRELGQRIQSRVTPSVTFVFDASLEYGARIEERLRDLGLGEGADDPVDADTPNDSPTPNDSADDHDPDGA